MVMLLLGENLMKATAIVLLDPFHRRVGLQSNDDVGDGVDGDNDHAAAVLVGLACHG